VPLLKYDRDEELMYLFEREKYGFCKPLSLFYNPLLRVVTGALNRKGLTATSRLLWTQWGVPWLEYENFSRVMRELWVNALEAVKHSQFFRSEGFIEIACVLNTKSLILTVRDTGVGLRMVDPEKLFGAGYSTKNGEYCNQGLGLYHSRLFLSEVFAAAIYADDNLPEIGATFTVIFPLEELRKLSAGERVPGKDGGIGNFAPDILEFLVGINVLVRGARVIYPGSAADISSPLIATNAEEFVFVDIRKFDLSGLNLERRQYADWLNAYARFKYENGYSLAHQVKFVSVALLEELRLLGATDIGFSRENNTTFIADFMWAHPAEEVSRARRIIYFEEGFIYPRSEALRRELSLGCDIVFVKAPLELLDIARKTFGSLFAALAPGSYIISDDNVFRYLPQGLENGFGRQSVPGVQFGYNKRGAVIWKRMDGGRAEADDIYREFGDCYTCAFRDPAQLAEILRLMRGMLDDKACRGDNSIRILSAGCSMGLEAYSLTALALIALRRNGYVPGSWKIETLGIDIDTRVLAIARAGVYGWRLIEYERISAEAELSAAQDAFFLNEWFKPADIPGAFKGAQLVAVPCLRSRTDFRLCNIMHRPSLAALGRFDIVVCRNVYRYFDNLDKFDRFLEQFEGTIVPGGFLVGGQRDFSSGSRYDPGRQGFIPLPYTIFRKKTGSAKALYAQALLQRDGGKIVTAVLCSAIFATGLCACVLAGQVFWQFAGAVFMLSMAINFPATIGVFCASVCRMGFDRGQTKQILKVAAAVSMAIETLYIAIGLTLGPFFIGLLTLVCAVILGICCLDLLLPQLSVSRYFNLLPFKLFGVVPVAFPLIAGPGMLGITPLAISSYGAAVTMAAFAATLALALALMYAGVFCQIVPRGMSGSRVYGAFVAWMSKSITLGILAYLAFAGLGGMGVITSYPGLVQFVGLMSGAVFAAMAVACVLRPRVCAGQNDRDAGEDVPQGDIARKDGGVAAITSGFFGRDNGGIACVDGVCCFSRQQPGFPEIMDEVSGILASGKSPGNACGFVLLYYPRTGYSSERPLGSYLVRWPCPALQITIGYSGGSSFCGSSAVYTRPGRNTAVFIRRADIV
jgi:chemotaxis methyl-accepting protein methylase/small neutral amino acid transporter SnatA (MarC family)